MLSSHSRIFAILDYNCNLRVSVFIPPDQGEKISHGTNVIAAMKIFLLQMETHLPKSNAPIMSTYNKLKCSRLLVALV